MNWYIHAIKSWSNFSGRAQRKELLSFVLWYFIVLLFVYYIGTLLSSGGIAVQLYNIIVSVPFAALCLRRLHDVGYSGWYLLILMIPLAGLFIILMYLIADGVAGENRYGQDPLLSPPPDYVK